MNAKSFLSNFGYIAKAPSGVKHLRVLISHLAFTGRLVSHSNDNSDALIDALDSQSVTRGAKRRGRGFAAVGYHDVPAHWRWVNIGLVGHEWGQEKPKSPFTYIDVSSIDNRRGMVREGPKIVAPEHAPSRARKLVRKGTVIYSTVRPYLMNIALIDRDYKPNPIASTAFAVIHPHNGVLAKFLFYYRAARRSLRMYRQSSLELHIRRLVTRSSSTPRSRYGRHAAAIQEPRRYRPERLRQIEHDRGHRYDFPRS